MSEETAAPVRVLKQYADTTNRIRLPVSSNVAFFFSQLLFDDPLVNAEMYGEKKIKTAHGL